MPMLWSCGFGCRRALVFSPFEQMLLGLMFTTFFGVDVVYADM